ncbi:MAG: hypothetical protein F6K58_08775 [Symploca sp. SIO2E9]|nr:hypothetical protein [Symploca sp. SIO2E9]
MKTTSVEVLEALRLAISVIGDAISLISEDKSMLVGITTEQLQKAQAGLRTEVCQVQNSWRSGNSDGSSTSNN